MGNRASNFSSYSCLDQNLSRYSVNPEYWNTKDIDSSYKDLGIVTASVMLVFILIGLPSNTAIILIILLRKLYRQPTESLLLSLAVSDFLTCIFTLPMVIVSGFAGDFIFGESDYVRCKVCQSGITLIGLSAFSLHVLALISIDRFIYIKLPLRYHKIITKKVIVFSLASVSILSVLLAIPPLFGFGDIWYNLKIFTCSPRFEHKTFLTKNIHYMLMVIGEGMVPLSVLLVTNIWVLFIAQKNIRKIYNTRKSIGEDTFNKTIRNRLSQEKHHKQIQLMRVFGAIFISNIITWSPIVIRVLNAYAQGSDNFDLWNSFIIIVSITSHSVVHPLIEATLLPDIRRYLCFMCLFLFRLQRNERASKKHDDSRNCSCHCLDILNASLLPQ